MVQELNDVDISFCLHWFTVCDAFPSLLIMNCYNDNLLLAVAFRARLGDSLERSLCRARKAANPPDIQDRKLECWPRAPDSPCHAMTDSMQHGVTQCGQSYTQLQVRTPGSPTFNQFAQCSTGDLSPAENMCCGCCEQNVISGDHNNGCTKI